MKKIIAAAAGLMIAGTAMVASAAVEFSGDARARYYYQDNYNLADNSDAADHWNSRVRLKMKGMTAGGSYAVMRLVAQDSAWGNGGQNNSTVDVDQAYVVVPMGCVEVSGGRQPLYGTTGYWNDVDLDNVRLTYAQNDTTVIGFYSVMKSVASEGAQAAGFKTDSTTGKLVTDANGDPIVNDFEAGTKEYDDSEDRLYGIIVKQGLGDWSVAGGVTYMDLDLSGITGINESGGAMVGLAATGPLGPVAFSAEFGFQEDGVVATDEQAAQATGDDGWGGYLTAGMDFDAFGVTLVGGFALDGFAWDVPVGFIMLAGDNQITPAATNVLGYYGANAVDTYFGGLKTSYQATDDLGLMLNLAYANMEFVNNVASITGDDDADAFEVSAQAAYTVNDGTVLYGRAGYLDVDFQDDPIWGAGVSLELKF